MSRSEAGRSIDHEEFEPVGTLALVALYFAVLSIMWLFTYFVEFLGNGPTVVGLLEPTAAAAIGGVHGRASRGGGDRSRRRGNEGDGPTRPDCPRFPGGDGQP
ncbi:hypothetical protein [Halovivax limisalsi]|uniref:hypothetical protein n=1 Tax=Halovivax limisalsi TaxID=1453760 RepID=UPI003CCDB3AA